MKSVELPELNLGDYVIFENMGAYTISLRCEFNSIPIPMIESYIENRHL